MDIQFCNNLKRTRHECNFTQKEIAQKLGVVDSCYANWEQGRTEPNIDMLRKLSNILEVSLDELINTHIKK
jgi:transcriptional regulator with XRE-family HTH domain